MRLVARKFHIAVTDIEDALCSEPRLSRKSRVSLAVGKAAL